MVQVVEHGGESRGFPAAGRAGHEHQALFQVAELLEDGRHAQLLEGKNLARDRSERGAHAAVLLEDVGPEAGDLAELEREVALEVFFEDLLRL
jgi:hypothetical protein